MVNPRDDLPADTVVVFRFVIACCAADAQPVAVLAHCKGAGALPRDSWVRVEGTLGSTPSGGRTVPLIRAERIVTISAPFQRFLQ
ncbi:MAG: hypothetical protein BIFFINMI_00077 [Phycisphaerae bacterium]|nr:hypothetical protein [Phycisphaerae bacterium]